MTDALLLLALFLTVVVVGTLATALHDAVERAWSRAWRPHEARATAPLRPPLRAGSAAPLSLPAAAAVRSKTPRRPRTPGTVVRVRA